MSKAGKRGARVTLDDVARHAGVSRSTASLVVRNSKLIAEATQDRVRASMAALGYVYNQSAANLRTQRTKTLGLVIADVSNPFYALLAAGIEAECGRESYLTIFADTAEDPARQKLVIERMIQHNVAGVFLCPTGRQPIEEIAMLDEVGIPVVLIMRYLDGVGASYVGPDNVAGIRQVVEHLVELGHSRIGFLGGPRMRSSSRDRREGFKRAMEEFGLATPDEYVTHADINRQAAMEACGALLDLPVPPTAIACYNDIMAFGAMLAMFNRGISPGGDVAVVGFDDIPEARLWTPSLTTMAIDAQQIGRLAAREMLEHIAEPERPRQKIIVQPRLIVRESSTSGALRSGPARPVEAVAD